MKLLIYILSFVFFFQQVNVVNSKEADNHMCFKRGFEIIFPYQEGIFKIKKETNISPDQKRAELNTLTANIPKIENKKILSNIIFFLINNSL